jgi:hypothetical protein
VKGNPRLACFPDDPPDHPPQFLVGVGRNVQPRLVGQQWQFIVVLAGRFGLSQKGDQRPRQSAHRPIGFRVIRGP